MAEAITVLGVAAAALQFAEIGYKIISKCSLLVKKSREYPEYFRRTHIQVQHLMYLAKVAAANTDTSGVVTSSEFLCAPREHQQAQCATIHSEPLAATPFQLENIWKDCSHQAEIINNALQSITREIEGRGIIGKWKKLRLHEKIYSIEKALTELERSKTTLGLWLGNESLCRIGHMHHNLAIMHNAIMQSRKLSFILLGLLILTTIKREVYLMCSKNITRMPRMQS